MRRVLFIKTSSLGDVIHHMPAVTEARARVADAQFTWVVEEAFAPLVALHPAVDHVIPIAARQWRLAAHRPSTWRDIAQFVRNLHAQQFDAVIDTQGLFFKSALIARCVRARRHGYDAKSIKDPVASLMYDVRHRVAWNQHAISRNRTLTAQALGYSPEGPPDFGLDRRRLAGQGGERYAVLLHATARPEKEWPEAKWRMLATALADRLELIVPFGTEAERARAERIASAAARARVPERMSIDRIARLIAGASLAIGVDTGLTHLAAALSVPLVAIFSTTEPSLTGPMGAGPIAVLHGAPTVLDVVQAAERMLLRQQTTV